MRTSEQGTAVLVVGGGLGGVAAAMTAAKLGHRVILTEEGDWIGGQLTSQAVPPDEHRWMDDGVASASYQKLRSRIRDCYRRAYPLRPDPASSRVLNPGLGYVSSLCHEPRVAVAALEEMLAPHVAAGLLVVLRWHRPVAAESMGDRIESVTLQTRDGARLTVCADYVIDATETGELLQLAGVEHVVGAEAQSATGEPHALSTADPLDQQAVSWCFAIEHRPGEDHVIEQPASYQHWRTHVDEFWPGPQLSWTDLDPITLQPRDRPLFDGDPDAAVRPDLWHYRRILARSQFAPGSIPYDVSLVNWPQIDYWELPLIGVDEAIRSRALMRARELSLSFLYWMQTEAPTHDGGLGYPGLRLRGDITDTADGLAKALYIRESRRIRAELTVVEQHIGVAARPAGTGAVQYADSVGIGAYRIDLHPSTGGRSYVDVDSYPFQIPLGALLPVRMENLLPACKNIGTTHITNGAYRLHPVEWSIGEAVGALVAHCISEGIVPRKVRADERRLANYQRLLEQGLEIPLSWSENIRIQSCTPESG